MSEQDRQVKIEEEAYLTPINPFTDAQEEIIKRKLEGLNNKEIAHERGRSLQTIVNQITAISDKIGDITGTRPRGGGWLQAMFGDVILTKPSDESRENNCPNIR